MPRGSLQIGLPCLEKYASSLVRTACTSSLSCRPSSISSRTACGSTLMPTPSGRNSGTLSNTRAGTPIWCRLSASVSPPMPPPAMRTVMVRPSCSLGRHDMGGGRGQLRKAGGNPHAPRQFTGVAASSPVMTMQLAKGDYRLWATFDPEVIVYWDVRDELITVIGNVALVRSTNKSTRRRDGNEVTGMTTYTDTYLRENGAWKCIPAQI